MFKFKLSAFTLVELLVVIAIIGLLSTIVLITTSGLREQADMARVLTWVKNVDSLLGAEAVGIWNLDENPAIHGTTVSDLSGWGNNGILNTSDGSVNKSASGVIANALNLDGVNDYVNIADNSSLSLGGSITIEAWVNANSVSGHTSNQYRIANKFSYPNSGWYLHYHSNGFFNFATYDGGGHTANYPIIPRLNTWYHVVGVSDGTNNKVYVNGISGSLMSSGTLINAIQPLQIGGYGSSEYAWNGLVDEVRIYNVALTADQVRSQYYVGLDRLLAKGLIDKEEYNRRIKV